MRHLLFIAIAAAASAGAQTQIDLRTQTKNVDFSSAPFTRPVKTGASLPSTCTTGDLFLNTGGGSGPALYACAANVWSPQAGAGGGGTITVDNAGTIVGSRATQNFLAGTGVVNVLSDDGQKINIQTGVDTAVVLSLPADQSGSDRFCVSSGGNPLQYSCRMTPTLTGYTRGMTVNWTPDVACTAGPLTLNIDTLGAAPLKQSDGATNLSSCPAGALVVLGYDGTVFRVLGGAAGSSGSGGASIFRGPYSSAPACGLSAFEYLATDSPHMLHCNGASSGQWFLAGAPATPASATSWTWVNQTGATETTQGGSVILAGTPNAGVSYQSLMTAVPPAPYSATACYVGMIPPTASAGAGLMLSQGTSAASPNVVFVSAYSASAQGAAGIYKDTSFTDGGSPYSGYAFTPPLAPPGSQTCFTVSDNGTQRKFWYSADGITRILVLATSDTDFITPDHVGVFVDSAFSSQTVAMVLLSFTVVPESI